MTELEKNKRKFVKKLDIVNESGKEFLLCFTNEQVKDSPDKVQDNDIQFDGSNPYMIRLLPGASLKFMEKKEVSDMLMNLFSSYKPEDVNKAHLYMHVLAKMHDVS